MTLDAMLKEITAYYSEDKVSPGIQLAYLTDKNLFYAAVHQFPSNVASRTVVAKATDETVEKAIGRLLFIWRGITGSTNTDGTSS